MLINCPECSQSISDKAASCPHCGFPITQVVISTTFVPESRPRKRGSAKSKSRIKLPNGYGSIKKYSGNRRRPYGAFPPVVEYNDNGSPISPKSLGFFESYNDAYKCLIDYHEGKFIKPDDKRNITFSEAYDEWMERRNTSISSEGIYKAAYKKCSALYDMHMRDIHLNEYQDVINDVIDSGIGINSVKNVKLLFGQISKYCLKNDYIEKDYSSFVEINKDDDIEKGEALTQEDINKLWNDCNDKTTQIILILMYSGLRISELKEVNIDLKEKAFIGGLKTSAGKNRYVPISPLIFDFVKDFDQDNYVVNTFRKNYFYPKMEELGILYSKSGAKNTPHNLRHTFSWLWDKYVVPRDDLAKHLIMGHSLNSKDVETSVYGHRTNEELRADIEMIKR